MTHITVQKAIDMLDEITVDKEGFAATWKLNSVDGGRLYYTLVRDNETLASISVPVDEKNYYKLELSNIKAVITAGSYLEIYGEITIKQHIEKDDPLTLQEFLDIYGNHYMSFVSIQNNIVTYQGYNYKYTVKTEIGVNNEFKEVETANSLYRIADTGFYEFAFE